MVILNDGTAYTNEGKTKYSWNLLDPDTINLSLEKTLSIKENLILMEILVDLHIMVFYIGNGKL